TPTPQSLRFFSARSPDHRHLHSFPTRRSSDLTVRRFIPNGRAISRSDTPSATNARTSPTPTGSAPPHLSLDNTDGRASKPAPMRSEEHTSELQSSYDLVCRLLLEKKKREKPSR